MGKNTNTDELISNLMELRSDSELPDLVVDSDYGDFAVEPQNSAHMDIFQIWTLLKASPQCCWTKLSLFLLQSWSKYFEIF